MEIIKHGEVKQKYETKCYNCGCEFIANRPETYTIATPVTAAIYHGILRKFRYCDCPDCKSMIMLEEVDMQGNPIKTEDTDKETAPDRSDCMYYEEVYGCGISPMKRCDTCHDYTPEVRKNTTTPCAKIDNNGFLGCQRIETPPNIPDEVLKKNMAMPKMERIESTHSKSMRGDWYWYADIEDGEVVAIGRECGNYCGGEHANRSDIGHLREFVKRMEYGDNKQLRELYQKIKDYQLPGETDGSPIEGKDGFGDTKIPEYAETYDNGIIGCQRLSVCPPIPSEVLKENMVTPKEIMEAHKDIERRRYEDNTPWWRKVLWKKVLRKFF